MYVCECVCTLSRVWFFVTSWIVAHHGTVTLLCPWHFSGKNIGVCCHFLLQGIFLTRGSNPGLLHLVQAPYFFSHFHILPLASLYSTCFLISCFSEGLKFQVLPFLGNTSGPRTKLSKLGKSEKYHNSVAHILSSLTRWNLKWKNISHLHSIKA